MSPFMIKTILAAVFLLAALASAFSMFTLMGKTEKKTDPATLRRIHRVAGWFFGLLLLVLAVFGADFLAKAGDGVSPRAVIHYTLALCLLAIFLLKLLSVRFFKQFLRIVPTLGMTVFVLSLVIVLGSAGYYALRGGKIYPTGTASGAAKLIELQGHTETGSRLFAGRCAGCHYADREDQKTGPGLKGLFRRSALPVSGRPVTVDSVLRQLKSPFASMPAMTGLTEQDLADLLAYLKTI